MTLFTVYKSQNTEAKHIKHTHSKSSSALPVKTIKHFRLEHQRETSKRCLFQFQSAGVTSTTCLLIRLGSQLQSCILVGRVELVSIHNVLFFSHSPQHIVLLVMTHHGCEHNKSQDDGVSLTGVLQDSHSFCQTNTTKLYSGNRMEDKWRGSDITHHILLEVDESAGCYLSEEDQQEAGEVLRTENRC